MGRIQRTHRSHRERRAAPTGVWLRRAGRLSRRRRGQEGRCALHDRCPKLPRGTGPAQAQLTRARSEAGRSRSEAQRAKVLVEQQAVSTEAWEQRRAADESAQAEVQAAQAAVETAQLNLERTQVRSPINGRASRARLTAGNLVAASDAASVLTTIVFQDRVYTYFEADEKAFLRYSRMARKGERPSERGGQLPVQIALADKADSLTPARWTSSTTRWTGAAARSPCARCWTTRIAFSRRALYPRATGRQRRILGRVDRRQGGADRPRP